MNVYIDPSFIINKENWSLIASESICKICKGILYDPIQCSKCQLIFCKQCIENNLKINTEKLIENVIILTMNAKMLIIRIIQSFLI